MTEVTVYDVSVDINVDTGDYTSWSVSKSFTFEKPSGTRIKAIMSELVDNVEKTIKDDFKSFSDYDFEITNVNKFTYDPEKEEEEE